MGCLPIRERRIAVACLSVLLVVLVALCGPVGLGTVLSWVVGLLLTIMAVACSIYGAVRSKTLASPMLLANEAGMPSEAGGAPARVDYLDRLKTCLTALVVMHHCTCAFVGGGWYLMIGNYATSSFKAFGSPFLLINQSYFMCLFFFVSGYFCPSSLDRKGRVEFLLDKYKRLGLPFVCYLLVGGPIVTFLTSVASGRVDKWSYAPNPGPPWFVAWLLVFCTAHALIGGPPMAATPRPPLLRLVGWGALLGVVQAVCLVLIPSGNFLMMPLTIGSLPFDVAFFCAGILAKRSGWLDAPLRAAERRLAWGISVLYMALVWGTTLANWQGLVHGQRWGSCFPSERFPIPLDAAGCDGGAIGVAIALGVLSGVFCVAMSAALTDLFQRRCNTRKCAYTVYLIHPLVVVPLTMAWIAVIDSCGVSVRFPPEGGASTTDVGGGRLWLGWVAVTLLSLTTSWVLAAGIRRLPGFRTVL